jgi:2-keto-4-pentenoate hydratase/2-oxohepta-3-ene-1,7-dioic acid hydratase in catechol pathway
LLNPIDLPIHGSEKTYEVSPTKIVCLGLNYKEHIAESQSVVGVEIPAEPVLFPKTTNVLIGPGESIVIPAFLEGYEFETPRVDHEAELAVIISDRCHNVPQDEALSHVYGFTCMNDVSQRNLQHGDKSGWYRGKSLDTFGPIGPRIVETADIGDPQDLDIVCRVNGRVAQESNTRHMIFKIPEIISFISRNFTLFPGDILLTGTPAGVSPLSHRDVVQVEIQGIGVLENPVVQEGR